MLDAQGEGVDILHVVNIIVMDETKIGGSGSFGRVGDGESVGFHSGHSV